MAFPLKTAKRFTWLLVIGSIAFCTFYWYCSSNRNHGGSIFMDGSTENWRWKCDSTTNTCQRRPWNYGDSGLSLRTCQMTCGPVPLWPQPNGETVLSNRSVSFDYTSIKIYPVSALHNEVRNALLAVSKMFLKDIKPVRSIRSDMKFFHISIYVVGNKSGVDFQLGADESYKLVVQCIGVAVRVSIKSATYFGARHGLETLRQLIWYDDADDHLRIISYAKIVDVPSFPYRGLLLDTSSNYIPVRAIKRTISAMASVKMNVFHWHITGSRSFPFAFKNMQHAIYGAYSSKKLYTNDDVINVIRFGRLLGVKVLLEINNPGDIGQGWTWGRRKGIGDLNVCYKNKSSTCHNQCSQLNPSNNHSYALLKSILQEFKNMTRYTDINHLGGRVDFKCWLDSPEVTQTKVFKSEGISGVLKHHHDMMYNAMLNIYNKRVPNIILWSDYFKKFDDTSENIDSRVYIAQINSESDWEDENVLTKKGYRVIISHVNKWDLSRLPHWSTVYDHRPWEQLLWSQREQVLGGEVLLWTKLIDEHTLDARLWPAAAAVAEVLWTDPQIDNLVNATLRLQLLRARLIEKGISAAAIAPKWCTQNPGACS